MPTDETMEPTPLVKKLNEQRKAAVALSRQFLERQGEGEELSAEDDAAFTRANKDVDRYAALMRDEMKRVKDERDTEEAYNATFRNKQGRKGGVSTKEEDASEPTLADRIRADLKASEHGEMRSNGISQPIPSHRQFMAERRDLLAGTATKGAETIPVTLVNALYEKLFDDSALLDTGPTILRTASGEQLKLPRLTALGNLSQANARVAEAGNIIEGDPTFDQVALDAYKYAQYTQVSRELVEDGVLDIEELIGRILGRNIANYVGTDLTLGTGTGQPRGVRTLVPAGNKVSSAAGGLFPTTDFDKFFDVIAKLKPGYRRNGKWLVNDQAMFTLRKIKMNSQYAWEPNLQGAGMPDRFLGYPILSDPNIPVPAASAGVTAIFGDFSQYYVRMVRDVRIEWSMEFAWVNDLLSVKAVFRADGDAIDDSAFAAFDSIA